MKSIWIVAGGTGGHIAPALGVAKELVANCKVIFITLEKNRNYPGILLEKNLKVVTIPAPQFPTFSKKALFFLPKLISSLLYLNKLSRSTGKPEVIIGFGGYPSFPPLLFGWINSCKLFLCEQNIIPGQVTKLFARVARSIFQSFPEIGLSPNEKFTGNPLSPTFSGEKSPLRKIQNKPKKILITGGSQGSKDLNDLYKVLSTHPFFSKVIFTLSTGPFWYNQYAYLKRDQDILLPFISDMKTALCKNDLIIARSGSGTIYEILWAKIPALLIPFPFAKDNHQSGNAVALEKLYLTMVYDLRPFNPQKATSFLIDAIQEGKFTHLYQNLKKEHYFPLDAHKKIAKEVLNEIDN